MRRTWIDEASAGAIFVPSSANARTSSRHGYGRALTEIRLQPMECGSGLLASSDRPGVQLLFQIEGDVRLRAAIGLRRTSDAITLSGAHGHARFLRIDRRGGAAGQLIDQSVARPFRI